MNKLIIIAIASLLAGPCLAAGERGCRTAESREILDEAREAAHQSRVRNAHLRDGGRTREGREIMREARDEAHRSRQRNANCR